MSMLQGVLKRMDICFNEILNKNDRHSHKLFGMLKKYTFRSQFLLPFVIAIIFNKYSNKRIYLYF